MATKRTAKAVGVIKKASNIYKGMKKEYQKNLQGNIRNGMNITSAAKKASKSYKSKYGANARTRWENALTLASAERKTKSTKPRKARMPKRVKADWEKMFRF